MVSMVKNSKIPKSKMTDGGHLGFRQLVVVVVVTQHGGEATFAEAATSSSPKTQKTQGTFQVEKEWYQPERRR